MLFKVARTRFTAVNALEIARLSKNFVSENSTLLVNHNPHMELSCLSFFPGECGKSAKLPKVPIFEVHCSWDDCSLGPLRRAMYHKVPKQ